MISGTEETTGVIRLGHGSGWYSRRGGGERCHDKALLITAMAQGDLDGILRANVFGWQDIV